MEEWLKISFVAFSSVILVVIVITMIKRRCCTRKSDSSKGQTQNLQNGISKLHHVSVTNKYYVVKKGFNWSDHPSLVTDAVENGWSRFAFTSIAPSSSIRSSARSILGSCVGNDHMSWEICQDSSDFMQKIRFSYGNQKLNRSSKFMSVVKTSLPLPGPHLGNSSFPQESYFEITILQWNQENNVEVMGKVKEDKLDLEKIKLIREDSSNSKANSESLVHVTSSSSSSYHQKIQESKENLRSDEFIVLSIGLTSAAAGSLPLKLPGSYQGSIGFNSNGSVFLDGKFSFQSFSPCFNLFVFIFNIYIHSIFHRLHSDFTNNVGGDFKVDMEFSKENKIFEFRCLKLKMHEIYLNIFNLVILNILYEKFRTYRNQKRKRDIFLKGKWSYKYFNFGPNCC